MQDRAKSSTTTSRSKWHPMLACGHAANAVCSAKNGIKYDPPIPSCAICDCTEVSLDPPDLTHRLARCCHNGTIKKSSNDLAFFEYLGPGSERALTLCNCGFTKSAHDYNWPSGNRVSKTPPQRMCDHFTAHGAWAYDSYYCGCRGWD